ncbi:MAG TPA: hypothetical protein H9694_07255 [Firmicutes bacterium]|nr:hypothetical protein [Bacillota bacterium]
MQFWVQAVEKLQNEDIQLIMGRMTKAVLYMDNNELLQMILHELKDLKITTNTTGDRLADMDERLKKIEDTQGTVDERLKRVELTQENVVAKNIQLLMEAQRETYSKVQSLDALEEKVDDIQTTVSVLKTLTVKK